MSKVKSGQSSPKQTAHPPQVPSSKAELERVICLLGSRAKTELNRKAQTELIALIGSYPNQKEASDWKQYLKQLLKHLPE